MFIINGSKSTDLGENLARNLGIPFENASTRIFPDGETYVRITAEVEGNDVFIVQTMFPDPNHSLMEFLLVADTVNDMGAKKITGIVPYIAYARQDQRFQPGEAFSIKMVANLIKSVGVERLITVDTHYKHVTPGEFELFGLAAFNLSAGRILLENISQNIEGELITIGPDFGSSELIKYATGEEKVLKKEKICPICGLSATQCQCDTEDKVYEISEMVGNFDFKDQNVVILDDIIASGGTMIQAIKKVKAEGARTVSAAATHGLFLKKSLETLKGLVDYLVVTDSIGTPVSKVSVSALIANVLKS